MGDNTFMEDVDEYLSSNRRTFLKTAATATAAGLAGCSGDEGGNGGNTDTSTDTENPTEQPSTDEGTETKSTETSGSEQDSGVSSLYDEDEPQTESEWEEGTFSVYSPEGWIEMENPEEQIPRENYDLEDFPHLEELEGNDVDVYDSENEAIYIAWIENEGQTTITAFHVKDYEDNVARSSDGSHTYRDDNADIEGILGEVVEGVDDVPEDLDEEYVQLLT
jgi:hypothetical protein